jgi:hypothetical protein
MEVLRNRINACGSVVYAEVVVRGKMGVGVEGKLLKGDARERDRPVVTAPLFLFEGFDIFVVMRSG